MIKCSLCGQPVDVDEHCARNRLSVIRETLRCVPGQTEVAAASSRMAAIERLSSEVKYWEGKSQACWARSLELEAEIRRLKI